MAQRSPEDRAIEARIRAHVRQQMEERGIHQTKVAELAGIDDGYISKILRGERGMGLSTVLKLCKALQINPTRILKTNPPVEFFRGEPVPPTGDTDGS